jgi:hypothetical protein
VSGNIYESGDSWDGTAVTSIVRKVDSDFNEIYLKRYLADPWEWAFDIDSVEEFFYLPICNSDGVFKLAQLNTTDGSVVTGRSSGTLEIYHIAKLSVAQDSSKLYVTAKIGLNGLVWQWIIGDTSFNCILFTDLVLPSNLQLVNSDTVILGSREHTQPSPYNFYKVDFSVSDKLVWK